MKFAAVAVLALAAVSTVDAQVSATRCNTPIVSPWVTSDEDPGKSCFEATGFKGSGFATPTVEVATKFCSSSACRPILTAVLAAKPATGDCFVSQSGTRINFYQTVVSVFVDVCAKVDASTPSMAPTPPPTTPAPTTAAPTTTPAPTTAAPTTAPAPTTAAPTTTPAPTTGRPQC